MSLSETVISLLRNPECPDYILRDAVLEENGTVANVYVVYGTCGEYSDRSEWQVAAFLDKEHADAFAAKLNKWCEENNVHNGYGTYSDESNGYAELECPDDPGFHRDYTGTKYGVQEIPLRADG